MSIPTRIFGSMATLDDKAWPRETTEMWYKKSRSREAIFLFFIPPRVRNIVLRRRSKYAENEFIILIVIHGPLAREGIEWIKIKRTIGGKGMKV